ncbi:4-hydroxybenzoyl-CoA thioesterase [Oleiphilus sp. HI0125]|uniref:acyl-CoA thioesterase n=1 Tax=Oleiphilus sp. HI0125 TaxID=1822266 RepID=UPI0007C247F7|nr:thioesterase family protein [Oleiphilus sp. HI0125]KZZ56429.1 4-hydroxybenzoyl-CoA thioesterase [Oleiphilus sp. HI0125]
MSQFTLKIRVRYNECDAQNVVFNARYADYADLASTEFLRASLGGYQELVARGFENQIVKLLIEWKAPARFDDILNLNVSVGRIGNSSFTLHTEYVNAQTNQVLATAEAVYVFVNAEDFTSCPIPDFVTSMFEHSKDYGVMDQSGC